MGIQASRGTLQNACDAQSRTEEALCSRSGYVGAFGSFSVESRLIADSSLGPTKNHAQAHNGSQRESHRALCCFATKVLNWWAQRRAGLKQVLISKLLAGSQEQASKPFAPSPGLCNTGRNQQGWGVFPPIASLSGLSAFFISANAGV